MFQSIILATDGSEYALHAAEKAVQIAKPNPQATITVVHVLNLAKVKSSVLENWNIASTMELMKRKVRSTEKILEAAGVDYKTEILRGVPGPEIVKYANKSNADLVILGSRGKNRLQELVLGSVSHKVAKRVNCPVLIVKQPFEPVNENASINFIDFAAKKLKQNRNKIDV